MAAMRARIPLLLVLLLVAVGAVCVWSPWRSGDTTVQLPPEIPAGARDARVAIDEVLAPAPEVARAPVADDEQAPETEEAAPVTLTVVEAATGEPVAGAEVFTATFQELEWGKRSRAHGNPDPEPLLRELGRSSASDANGDVRLERFDDDTLICARRGELFRFASWYELQNQEGRIPLFRDRDLEIEVVDAAGRPCAGVLVVLDELRTSRRMRLWSAKTSALGIARLRHVLGEVANWRHHGLGEAEVFATFGFPAADAPRVPVDLDDPPTEPIRLVLPPTGEVAAAVEREDGEPLQGELTVRLRRAESETAPSGVWGSSFLEQEALTENGVAGFPFVGLGLDLEVESYGPKDCEPAELRAPGPMRPGERVEIVLEHPLRRLATLTGRVLRADGSPVADAELTYVTRAAPRSPRLDQPSEYDYGALETDAGGRFELVLESIDGEVVTLFVREFVEYRFRHEAGATLPSPLRPGLHDVGDLMLVDAPLVVSGEVVDEQGSPVRASIDLRRKVYEDERGDDWFWDLHIPFSAQVDEESHFEVRGSLEPGEYDLRVMSDGYHVEVSPPFAPGRTDLRIVLHKLANQYLLGSVRLDEGIPGGILRVEAQTPGEEESRSRELYFSDREHFGSRVAAGPNEVTVYLHDWIPLTEPVTVHVEPDTICEPPALQEIDLRGRLHPLSLRVEDEEGHGLDAWVTVAASEGDDPTFGQPVDEGTVRLITPWLENDLLVTAPGFRSARVVRASGECRVRLTHGVPVRLALSAPVALPADCSLEARLVRAGESAWDSPLYGRRIDDWVENVVPARVEGSELGFVVPAPGEWDVEWLLEWRTEKERESLVLETPARRLVLVDRSEVQRFEVDPPTGALMDAALAEMQSWVGR